MSAPPTPEKVETQMAYVDQHQFDSYSQIVDHAQCHKTAFDKRVLAHPPWEVTFKARDLVQVYRQPLQSQIALR